MLKALIQDKFDPRTKITLGVDFYTKKYRLFGIDVITQFWDMGGVSRFDFLRERFYKGGGSVVLVADLSRSITFEELNFFIQTAVNAGIPSSKIILTGNKADLFNSSSEIPTYLSMYLEEYNLAELIKTSARFQDNLELVFEFGTILAMHEKQLITDLQLRAYKEEIDEIIVNPVFVPTQKRVRRCWKCNRILYFSEFSTSNHYTSRERLMKLWESEYLEFYCCKCYKQLKRNKKRLIA